MTVQEIIEAFTTLADDGTVQSFDIDNFSQLVDQLVAIRKELKAQQKETAKAQKKEQQQNSAEAGRIFFESLKVGDYFRYRKADGTILVGCKRTTKSGVYHSAACDVSVNGEAKPRYPKFYQIITDDTMILDETSWYAAKVSA